MKSGKFSAEFLQKVRSVVSMVETVGQHVILKKSGSNYVGLCPFHSERTPSFSVSETKQLFHCYGCSRGGDLFSFVMEILGVGFGEAVEELCERARIPLPKEFSRGNTSDSAEERRRAALQEKIALASKLNRFAAAFFHRHLERDNKALNYLRSRGVESRWTQSFYLGSSPDQWDALASYFVSSKAPLDLATEIGLVRPSTRSSRLGKAGPGYFDLFRNRVVFPILNLRGKVAGFGGRAFGEDTPKYLNSPESLLFHKGKLAFGLFQAQKHIREADEIILVEGYFDVLALHMAGFQNAVATCGTSLTSDHLKQFSRFASKITLLFDGDKAGIAATERAMEVGLENGMVLFGASIPDGCDPDEWIMDPDSGCIRKDARERMSTILKDSKALLDARMEAEVRLLGPDPEDRVQALKKIGQWLGRFRDPVGREIRVDWVQKKLGVSRQLILGTLGVPGTTPVAIQALTSVPTPAIRTRVSSQARQVEISSLDRVLLSGIAYGNEYSKVFWETAGMLPPQMTLSDLFDYSPAREAVRILNPNEGIEKVLSEEVDPQLRSVFTEAMLAKEPFFSLDVFRGAVTRAVGRIWARFSQQIKAALSDAEAKEDADLQKHLMKEYLDVQRKMKDFSSFYDEA